MSYENPQQPEGINVSDEHPLRELFLLLTAVSVTVVVLVVVLSSVAGWLARFVPFAAEQQIARTVGVQTLLIEEASTQVDADLQMRQEFVLELGQTLLQLAQQQDPQAEDISVTLHYNAGPTVNAYATLGGHVVMYDGLVKQLRHENALAMVLAHEIGHVKLRHPIVAMGRGLTVTVALSSLLGVTDNGFIAGIIDWIGYSSTLSFSREQERAADAFAARLLLAHYGHLDGAEELFTALGGEGGEGGDSGEGGEGGESEESDSSLPGSDFLSTHPDLMERINELREQAITLGVSGTPRTLPWEE